MAADHGDSGLARLVAAATQDLDQHAFVEFRGKGDDVEGEQRHSAHRVDIAQGVGGGDRTERVRIVDDGREEIQTGDDGMVAVPGIHRRVVGGVEADQHVSHEVATESLERAGQVRRT